VITGNTGSDKAVERVREWLQDCAENHSCCPSLPLPIELPTRVLKIEGPRKGRLYVIADEIAPYLCPSHCWGKSPVIKTTLASLDSHQAGMVWDELSKTFQHAIDFTYRLDYTYLWIDSLCVIQDSENDWRYEASNMASIYENACVTLCASNSADSSEGCYATVPSVYQSKRWSFMDANPNDFEIHIPMSLRHSSVTIRDDPNLSGIMLPLLSRVWSLQERILSPRTVDFSALELVWDCAVNQIASAHKYSLTCHIRNTKRMRS
jgi:hypothetical protein